MPTNSNPDTMNTTTTPGPIASAESAATPATPDEPTDAQLDTVSGGIELENTLISNFMTKPVNREKR